MPYTFLLEDLAGNQVSELPGATSKQFTRALCSMSTAGVVVPLWHEFADFMLQGDALLKVVDINEDTGSRVTCFHGRLVTAEEVAEAGKEQVSATFADGFWELLRRLCGKSTTGYIGGTPLAPILATQVFTDLFAAAEAEAPLGIRLGSVTPTTVANVATGPHFYAKIGEVLAQIAAVLGGPDWRVDPIDKVATSNPSISRYCEMIVAPVIGQTRLDQPFEYGTGRLNVRSYRRGVSNEGTATRLFNLPDQFPEGAGAVVSASDATAQARRGLLEDVVAAALTVNQMRQALVDLHLSVRKGARQTITFQPVNDLSGERLPRLRTDYDVGDFLPFRAAIERSEDDEVVFDRRIDSIVRVYQVAVQVDPESGADQPTLTVSPS